MKNWKQSIVGIAAIIAIAFIACDNGNNNEKPILKGSVSIDGIMEVDREAKAVIANSNGTNGKFTYQWTKSPDGVNNIVEITDADGETYLITQGDVNHMLGVVVSNEDEAGTIKGGASAAVAEPTILTESFMIGDVTFEFKYRESDTTSWGKIGALVENYKDYITTNPGSSQAGAITNLESKTDRPSGAPYIIVVDYSKTGKAIGFAAKDGQTLTVGNEYIENTNIIIPTLSDAFGAMYNKPWPTP